jgi:hypothetical protein
MGVVDDALGTNIFGPNSSDRALNAQRDAALQANATQKYIYDTTRQDYQPWRDAGVKALAGLQDPNFGKDLTMDPGYQFRMDQGTNAINAAAAARGMGNSGATLKALARYGQDFASNEYNNAYNRTYGRLSSLAGMGQGATGAVASAGQNYGNNVSANQMGFGNSAASSILAQSNKQVGALSGALSLGALAFSDERLKTNIAPISKQDLSEMKRFLKAYAFNYKSKEHGNGDWVGIMAQDLEKSKLGKTLVVENEQGHKMIDLKKVLSMFLATMAEA